jgi:peptidoglycan-N-acetylglucosamine deacetylase
MAEAIKILSVDVEDWFHILDNSSTATEKDWANFPSRLEDGLMRILDAFDRHGQKATFFVLGWIARKHPNAVAEIVHRGHEIASHSDLHGLVYTQSPCVFKDDLVRSLDAIENATGHRPTAYRAPGFSITERSTWAFDILAQNGIEVDCSVFPASRNHGGLPTFPTGGPCILETSNGHVLRVFPINFVNVLGLRFIFSGGGYFRLAPVGLLKRWFAASDYLMTYFHPRDFDPDQPLVSGLSAVRRFKSYYGLRSALSKLEALLETTKFMQLREAVEKVAWDDAERIVIGH